MKYYVMHVSNDNLQIKDMTEWENLESAKAKFHGMCQALWAEPSVISATVKIVDTQLDTVENYKEFVHHDQTQTKGKTETQPADNTEDTGA